MATESYVQPPPNNSSGPKLDTRTRVIGSDTKHAYSIGAGKLTKAVSVTITRPANTTTYASGDAVTDVGGAAMTFAAVARANGESGAVVGAICAGSGNETLKPSLELWLFGGSAAPTPDADNAAYTPTDAECQNVLGVITFANTAWLGGIAGTGGSSVAPGTILPGTGSRILYNCDSSHDDLFGLVVVRNAYVPLSSETLKFTLFLEQD